jgi:hypothetical protein
MVAIGSYLLLYLSIGTMWLWFKIVASSSFAIAVCNSFYIVAIIMVVARK